LGCEDIPGLGQVADLATSIGEGRWRKRWQLVSSVEVVVWRQPLGALWKARDELSASLLWHFGSEVLKEIGIVFQVRDREVTDVLLGSFGCLLVDLLNLGPGFVSYSGLAVLYGVNCLPAADAGCVDCTSDNSISERRLVA
jgi:hypothetical protein